MARNSTEPKPTHVSICDLAEIAYAESEEWARQGYSFDPSNLPQHFAFSGHVAINMILRTATAAK